MTAPLFTTTLTGPISNSCRAGSLMLPCSYTIFITYCLFCHLRWLLNASSLTPLTCLPSPKTFPSHKEKWQHSEESTLPAPTGATPAFHLHLPPGFSLVVQWSFTGFIPWTLIIQPRSLYFIACSKTFLQKPPIPHTASNYLLHREFSLFTGAFH